MRHTTTFYFPWLLMFIVVKVGGTAFATWSWLWVFLPIVPDLVLILHKLGFL
jgi:hypothetical protein